MKGMSFWDAVSYRNFGLGSLAISAGIGALVGGAGSIITKVVPAPLAAGAKWLISNPIAKWGLIGGELEWGRQYVSNIFSYNAIAQVRKSYVSWYNYWYLVGDLFPDINRFSWC